MDDSTLPEKQDDVELLQSLVIQELWGNCSLKPQNPEVLYPKPRTDWEDGIVWSCSASSKCDLLDRLERQGRRPGAAC